MKAAAHQTRPVEFEYECCGALAYLAAWYPNAAQVHLPVHASWLNQVEIYFSVLQRKVMTPNEFASLEELEANLLAFERCYEQTAQPFDWKFTRSDLERLAHRLNAQSVANPVLVA